MTPRLAACFDGPFAPWRNAIPAPGLADAAARPARDLLKPGVAAGFVERYAAGFGAADRRAVGSLWTQWYLGLVIVPYTAALVGCGRVLPVGLDELAIGFGDTGLPETLVLPGDGLPGRALADPFAALVDGHLAPLLPTLARLLAVSPRLVWANAGTVLDWALSAADEAASACPSAHPEGRRRLSARQTPCGGRNPLCGAVARTGPGPDARCRTVCCLRYRLPGIAGCGGLCPLPEAGASAADAA